VRPTTLAGLEGQDEVLGERTILRALIEKDNVPSIILWGNYLFINHSYLFVTSVDYSFIQDLQVVAKQH
jgi:hypothetical protein